MNISKFEIVELPWDEMHLGCMKWIVSENDIEQNEIWKQENEICIRLVFKPKGNLKSMIITNDAIVCSSISISEQ